MQIQDHLYETVIIVMYSGKTGKIILIFNHKLNKYALSFLPDRVDFENLINEGSILNPTGGENGPSPIFVNATARTVYSW